MNEMKRRGCVVLFLGACALALPGLGLAGAQEQPADASPAPPTPTTGPTITIHGYLTQAYAGTDGNQFVGIPKGGTADYRTAALQVRADMTRDDSFIVQLAHERLGESPVTVFRQDVELDWIFYEHRFDNSSVKVGKVKIPFGIYNEVRDVGTILPFYRPAGNFYGESSFELETVDGVVLSHTFQPVAGWTLDGDVYYGNGRLIAVDTSYYRGSVKNNRGIELWLQTPVRGLRVGGGWMRFDLHDSRQPQGQESPWSSYHVSVSGEFGRFVTHAEALHYDFAIGTWESAYLHVGYQLTDKIVLNGQIDRANIVYNGFYHNSDDNDRALGVNYVFRPDLVLKAEHHWNKGYQTENPLPDIFAPAPRTRYWILSLSTSF